MKTGEKTGEVVGALTVRETDEIMLITNKGQMVRTRVKEIRETGRNTMGVKLMDLRNAAPASNPSLPVGYAAGSFQTNRAWSRSAKRLLTKNFGRSKSIRRRHWQTSRQANKSSIARQGRRRSTAALHEDTAYCTLIERDRVPE
jgi:DNA gyrase C-terminal domain, beta-propeller